MPRRVIESDSKTFVRRFGHHKALAGLAASNISFINNEKLSEFHHVETPSFSCKRLGIKAVVGSEFYSQTASLLVEFKKTIL